MNDNVKGYSIINVCASCSTYLDLLKFDWEGEL